MYPNPNPSPSPNPDPNPNPNPSQARRGHRAVAFLPEFHLNYGAVGASKRSAELGIKDPKQVPPGSTVTHRDPPWASAMLTRAAYFPGRRTYQGGIT